jgi:hypothetical protein
MVVCLVKPGMHGPVREERFPSQPPGGGEPLLPSVLDALRHHPYHCQKGC